MSSILLIGLSKLGLDIAKKMNEMGQQIMAVDRDENRVENAMPYVTNALIGDSTNEDFLRTLGINNFDLCIVAIGSDFQSSLETVSQLKEMGAQKVVAHAVSDIHAKFLLRNGADDVVQPSKQIAEWIAVRYTSQHVINFVDMDNECSIFELKIPKKWVGKTIREINVRQVYHINIIAIKTAGKLNMSLTCDTVFTADSTMLVIGKLEDMRRFI